MKETAFINGVDQDDLGDPIYVEFKVFKPADDPLMNPEKITLKVPMIALVYL